MCPTESSPRAPTRPLHALWLGRRPYPDTYRLQLELLEHVKSGDHDLLLLLEHEPCITMGRGAHADNLLVSEAALAELGVSLHRSDRGGDVTLHAPGQLVAYPIVNLNHGRKDVRRYVNALTDCMRALVAPYGVDAGTIPNMIGLWADAATPARWPGHQLAHAPQKLGAVGVRISRWITMHGFALNLTTDMRLFRLIVPCGIRDYPVASLELLTGERCSVRETAGRAHRELALRLGLVVGRFAEHTGELAAPAVIARLDAAQDIVRNT